MSQENVEVVAQAVAARNRGDMDAIVRLVSPDVVVDATRRLLDPATFTGHDGLKTFIASLEEAWSEQQTRVERWVDTGDQVVALVHLRSTGRSSEVSVDAHPSWVYEVRDGKIARMTVYQTWDEALEAVGLSE